MNLVCVRNLNMREDLFGRCKAAGTGARNTGNTGLPGGRDMLLLKLLNYTSLT